MYEVYFTYYNSGKKHCEGVRKVDCIETEISAEEYFKEMKEYGE